MARKDLRVLGELPWDQFPTRPARRPAGGPWPGTPPAPRGPYVAAFLVKLSEQKLSMGALRTYLVEHPALVWVLGFPLVADPTAAWGFDVARSLPSRKPFSRVRRELDNQACQFLLDAPIPLVRAALPDHLREQFGQVVCGDTQAILAWVREKNPKVSLIGR
ncbi:MAG: hypothetical protein M5U01_24940 [Ardenticatenaceae bacterium]|nr:hypothetical protein [Ardenticatenaceae bacterium]